MRIIALSRLREHWKRPGRGDSEQPLKAWHDRVGGLDWTSTAEVRTSYGNASFVGDRVVFNIAGNKYRLVTYINYAHRIVYVRWVGTHAEYDELNRRELLRSV